MADEVCGAFGWQPYGQDSQYGKSFCGTSPFLENQNPAPGSSGNPANSNVYLEVSDNDNDLDESTVKIYINGDLAWSNGSVQQPGYSGYKVETSSGYSYTISTWDDFIAGSQSIRVTAEDADGNSLDETYDFGTVGELVICPRIQWGDFQWGAYQWGQFERCSDAVAEAINENTIRIYFNYPVVQWNPSGVNDALNPTNYAITGGFRPLSVISVATVDATTVDLTVLEMTDGGSYEVEFSVPPFTGESAAYTGFGIHPRPVSVVNDTPGIMEVYFSEQMLNDSSFSRPSSYRITPHGSASFLFVTDVVVDKSDLAKAVLLFSGGGSSYTLSVPGLMDPAGNYCSPSDIVFNIENPAADELEAGQKLYLDTDLGAMSLGTSELSRRRIEDLTILRAKNAGHSQQFSLIASELDRSGINRDDRKLKLFKG